MKNTILAEADHHDGSFFHRLRAFMGLAYVEGAETENRGFFADRTAVAENGLGALLEANVIVEAHRLEVSDPGMKDGVLFGDPFRGAGMGAEDDR